MGCVKPSLRGGLGVWCSGVVVGEPEALLSDQLCLSCLCTPVRELARGADPRGPLLAVLKKREDSSRKGKSPTP